MKLYATVTSERASKGQGGNKYLDITIAIGEDWETQSGNEDITCRIVWNNGEPRFRITLPSVWKIDKDMSCTAQNDKQIKNIYFEKLLKGKKQKGENPNFGNSDYLEGYSETLDTGDLDSKD